MLDDLLVELLGGLLPDLSEGPGTFLLLSSFGTIGVGVELWMRASVGNPIVGPIWAWSTFVTAIIFGVAGVVLGFAGVRRREFPRLAWACVVINGLSLAAAYIVTR
ncbi:MAG TPA: hypothetical protein VJN96_09805 [Vicinamibacterales bacterium]|nr:hypothetical protein [Vicinamibacterales bacterium]